MSKGNFPRHSRKVIYDASNSDQIKMAEDNEKDREKDIDFIMSQPRGRRFMYELIRERCHARSVSHVPGDPHSSAFNEGARAVGEALELQLSREHHTLYIKMLDENNGREY